MVEVTHPAFEAGRAALITGGASGIGFATAERLAAIGMRLCIVDIGGGLGEAARRPRCRPFRWIKGDQ